jgi:large subunit ribosomal protein L31
VILEVFHTETTPAHELRQRVIAILLAAGEPAPLTIEDFQALTRSTKESAKKEIIDGVEHSVISMGITSNSHPFFTGQKQFVDTEGRIDKFTKRFGAVRRVGKPKIDA